MRRSGRSRRSRRRSKGTSTAPGALCLAPAALLFLVFNHLCSCHVELSGQTERAKQCQRLVARCPSTVCRYDDEEGGGHGEAFNPFAGDDASYRKKEVELQKRLTRRDGSLMTLAQSKKASQLQADNNAWEENRILTSGAGRLREVNLDFDDEEARKRQTGSAHLLTIAPPCCDSSTAALTPLRDADRASPFSHAGGAHHASRARHPPAVPGRQDCFHEADGAGAEQTRNSRLSPQRPSDTQSTAIARARQLSQQPPLLFSLAQVLPVKDVTCDMAKIARAGSALVKEVRQKREGDKSRERFWELGGTAMGNAIGVKKEEKAEDGDDKAALVNADGEVDFKAR